MLKPEIGSEHWCPALEGVKVRAHTPSGVWVERLDAYAKPIGILIHVRDSAWKEMLSADLPG